MLGLHANPVTYRGHAAADYEAMADLHTSQQRVIVAHALLGLARLLSDRGPAIQTATHERVAQKHFDAVVFEAYAEVPNEPGKSYQAFRVVRYLDPSRRRG